LFLSAIGILLSTENQMKACIGLRSHIKRQVTLSRQAQTGEVKIPYGDSLKIVIYLPNTHLKGWLLPGVSTETPEIQLKGERLCCYVLG
jgi:hypothetical protein